MKNSRMSVGEDGETCGLSDLDRMIMMMKRALQGSLHLYGMKGFFVFNLNKNLRITGIVPIFASE